MGAGVECGQKWWSLRAWKTKPFRRFPGGFAIGPFMFWR